MIERWQRELVRWTETEPPPALATRVAQGPRGEGMPPSPQRGQRIVSGVLAVAVFGAALVFLANGFREGSPVADGSYGSPAVLRLVAGDDRPIASLTYGGRGAGMAYTSYCWSQANSGTCVDLAAPRPFTDGEFLPIPAGTAFVLEDPDGARVRWWIAEGDDPMEARNTSRRITIEELSSVDPGRYVLSVDASWKGRGHLGFFFALEVVEPGVSPDEEGVPEIDRGAGES